MFLLSHCPYMLYFLFCFFFFLANAMCFVTNIIFLISWFFFFFLTSVTLNYSEYSTICFLIFQTSNSQLETTTGQTLASLASQPFCLPNVDLVPSLTLGIYCILSSDYHFKHSPWPYLFTSVFSALMPLMCASSLKMSPWASASHG